MLFLVPPMARHRTTMAARRRNLPRRRRIVLSTPLVLLVARMVTPQPGQPVAQMAMVASASPRERLLVQVAQVAQVAAGQVAPMAVARVVADQEATDVAMVSVAARH